MEAAPGSSGAPFRFCLSVERLLMVVATQEAISCRKESRRVRRKKPEVIVEVSKRLPTSL